MARSLSVVMLGASGAVGSQVVSDLLKRPELEKLSLLNRRPVELPNHALVSQHMVNVMDPASYEPLLAGHRSAICTLGVGQPSKMSKAEFIRIDKDAVLDFARACKRAGVEHFELSSAVGANPDSSSLYLRTKGELEEELKALNFTRLSLFQPSMILTPTNRYGLSQALILALWPGLSPLLRGAWRKYRGIPVATLGKAMAFNVLKELHGLEVLQWDHFITLSEHK
jgi:uncharacterized protein YbjT (DUF2867 family)